MCGSFNNKSSSRRRRCRKREPSLCWYQPLTFTSVNSCVFVFFKDSNRTTQKYVQYSEGPLGYLSCHFSHGSHSWCTKWCKSLQQKDGASAGVSPWWTVQWIIPAGDGTRLSLTVIVQTEGQLWVAVDLTALWFGCFSWNTEHNTHTVTESQQWPLGSCQTTRQHFLNNFHSKECGLHRRREELHLFLSLTVCLSLLLSDEFSHAHILPFPCWTVVSEAPGLTRCVWVCVSVWLSTLISLKNDSEECSGSDPVVTVAMLKVFKWCHIVVLQLVQCSCGNVWVGLEFSRQ